MIQLLVVALALGYALRANPPESLGYYLRAQLAYSLVMYPAYLLLGIDSRLYAILWAVFTAAVLAFAGLLTLLYLYRWGTGVLIVLGSSWALFLAILAGSGIAHRRGFADYVNLAEAAILVGLAFTLGSVAPFLRPPHRMIAATLAVLWLAQAAWSFGWPMHWQLPLWERLNAWYMTFCVATAVSWLGLYLRADRRYSS